MKELIYKGSTKDIYQVSGEELLFEFTDRYSIFDYGEMPDHIPEKGNSTANLTYKLFKTMENKLDIKTHILRMGEEKNQIVVKRFNVPRDFDSSMFYQKKPINSFIPLEVIYRLGVPVGSSLIKRMNYKIGDKFETPLIEFTTKLESIDRFLSLEEAFHISGISEIEMEDLKQITIKIAKFLEQKLAKAGLILWDGKLEFAFGEIKENGQREIILVDSISIDEMRITFNDFSLSKEALRQIYLNTDWYKKLEQEKKLDSENFRDKVSAPEHLPHKSLNLISEMYRETQKIIADENTNEFSSLKNIVSELKNEYFSHR